MRARAEEGPQPFGALELASLGVLRAGGREDRRVIKNMGAFVRSIADIDDNGISLRYPRDKTGELTQDRPLFVNNEEVVSHLEKFVNQLELIDFDLIGKDDG